LKPVLDAALDDMAADSKGGEQALSSEAAGDSK
jgi:hypothetical protein